MNTHNVVIYYSLPMTPWNGKEPTTPGYMSKTESNNMVVGLGEGLSVTLWGGESAVDPSRRSGHEESGNVGLDEGAPTTIDRWTVTGTLGSAISSMSLWMKLHLNSQTGRMLVSRDVPNSGFRLFCRIQIVKWHETVILLILWIIYQRNNVKKSKWSNRVAVACNSHLK